MHEFIILFKKTFPHYMHLFQTAFVSVKYIEGTSGRTQKHRNLARTDIIHRSPMLMEERIFLASFEFNRGNIKTFSYIHLTCPFRI